jgi:hypothetical protein
MRDVCYHVPFCSTVVLGIPDQVLGCCILHLFAMAPKKAKSSRTSGPVKFDPDKLEVYKAEVAASHRDGAKIFGHVEEYLRKHGGPPEWLSSLTATDDDTTAYAAKLYKTFPPPQGTSVNGVEWKQGLTTLHLFQLGFDPDKDGYSIPSCDEYLAMIAIMLCRGCQTDPAIPGIEALSVVPSASDMAKRQLRLVCDDTSYPNYLHIGAAAYVKGKKRSGSALAIAMASIESGYDMQTEWPQLWNSLRCIHCTTTTSPADDITNFINSLTISVTNSTLRQRPTIFAWVQNLKKRFAVTSKEQTLDIMDKFDGEARGGLGSKLTKKERICVEALMIGMCTHATDRLLIYAREKGVTKKTAFGLDALTATMWSIDEAPRDVSPKYQALLKTTRRSTELVITRLIQDNEATPDTMRKPFTAIEVDVCFLRANLLMNSIADAITTVPADVYQAMMTHNEDTSSIHSTPSLGGGEGRG